MKNKLKKFLTNYKLSIPTALAILLIGGVVFAMNGKEEAPDSVVAAKTTVAQEVTVTGRVVPAKKVDLAIQSGGEIVSIPVQIGQKVAAGQTLLRVNSDDLQIRLGRQRAALEKARIALAKEAPKTNAEDDLVKAYDDGFNTVADAFLDLPSIVTGLDTVLDQVYLSNNSLINVGDRARDMRRETVSDYYAAEDRYQAVLKKYRTISRESDEAAIEAIILETYDATKLLADAVKKTNNFVDYLENELEDSLPPELATDQNNLDEFTSQTNAHLISLLEIKDTIKNAREGITDQHYDVTTTGIDVRQAELDVQDTLVQISERSIKAPMSGTVADITAELGETISAGSPVISLISASQFQIEANLPEADIAKVKVGAEADILLDAYGSDVHFPAKVVSINPAETIIDGVATYTTTFQFITADERIKSGMTADITVFGERKENVLAIPQRAVITKDDRKYVQVLEGEEIVEKTVVTGLRGSDGNVEILDGLKEGDKIIVFIEEK